MKLIELFETLAYHGSPAADAIHQEGFQYRYLGKGNDQFGFGFYFNTNASLASGYGKVVNVELNIKNPIILYPGAFSAVKWPRLTVAQVKRIILAAPDINDPDGPLSNHGDVRSKGFKHILNLALAQTAYQKDIFPLMNDFFKDSPEKFLKIYSQVTKYDGVIVNFADGEQYYIAWFPEQIKILNAKQPIPESVDITQTQEFKEWFGNSKIVDSSGRPLVVYHATHHDFNEFKPSRFGKMGAGMYFTSFPEDAKRHVDKMYGAGGKVIPVYLKVENLATISHPFAKNELPEKYDGIWAAKGVKGAEEIIVFSPNQIKSIHNNGKFSDSPNIFEDLSCSYNESKQIQHPYTRPSIETISDQEGFDRTVLINPTPNQVMRVFGNLKDGLRGLTDGVNLLVWDAYYFTHNDILQIGWFEESIFEPVYHLTWFTPEEAANAARNHIKSQKERKQQTFTESTDIDYCMQEGCGIFAVQLAEKQPGGEIWIISNKSGEKWSRSIPFEVTHVIYRKDGELHDVKGVRTLEDILGDFDLEKSDISLKGPYSPAEFERKFMGDTDDKPLYGRKNSLQESKSAPLYHATSLNVAGQIIADNELHGNSFHKIAGKVYTGISLTRSLSFAKYWGGNYSLANGAILVLDQEKLTHTHKFLQVDYFASEQAPVGKKDQSRRKGATAEAEEFLLTPNLKNLNMYLLEILITEQWLQSGKRMLNNVFTPKEVKENLTRVLEHPKLRIIK